MTELGAKEAEFISQFASRNGGFFRMSEAVHFWKSPRAAYDVLSRLERKRWIERIEQGKYMVIPLEAGPDRVWSADPYRIATELVTPAAIAYWSAIRHWNWTEQLPRTMFIQTTARKNAHTQNIFGVHYQIVTVTPQKYYGHVKEWRDGKSVLVTDKEKTLVDCADDVGRAGTIEELSKAVKAAAKEISWPQLNDHVGRFPNGAVKKRLGYLFETLIPDMPEQGRDVLEKWRGHLTSGVALLQPAGKRTGPIVTRWHLQINAGRPEKIRNRKGPEARL